jgi:CheY-like chemotaxis protein
VFAFFNRFQSSKFLGVTMPKQMNFLLVDDDSDDIALFEEILAEVDSAVGFQSAKDGQEALNLLRGGNADIPDLIFLDLNMPRMGGKECLAHLKNDAELRDVPVIMYTTSSQSKDIEEAMMSGAVCFITKPSNVKELRHILSSIIHSMPHGLEKALRTLSNSVNAFIVC